MRQGCEWYRGKGDLVKAGRKNQGSASGSVIEQEKLLPFLLNPDSYSPRPSRVRLLQTHSSFVFVAAPYVYKVKKPVNFGFLDFSTLEKRRHFCEREVELNRRLNPEMYLGVVPISRLGDGLVIGEGDEVLEYAVWMRKLPDGRFLDQLLRREKVGPGDLDRVATKLKEFYLAQHPREEVEEWGRVDRLRISTDENFRQAEPFIGRTISRPAFEAIRRYTDSFYQRRAEWFDARMEERWIRDCHGDLHLEHIHLTPRALHIFDCIEFNDRFRYVDVANDVAFLAMDLDYNGRPDLARGFAEKMAVELNDPGMLLLLDFYKCYRAYVRGKVENLQSIAHAAPERERTASAERARRYFRQALRYAVAGSGPLVLAVMGRIASGKSTLAAALGSELGCAVYSSDRVRKEMAGFPLYERSCAAARERLYSSEMTRRTYDRLFAAAEVEAGAGRCVILDATFARPEHRQRLLDRMAGQPVSVCFLEAQAGDRVIRDRLRRRGAWADEVSDARLEDFAALTALYEAPDELAPLQRIRVRTANTPETTLTRALEGLVRARLDEPCHTP